MEETGSLRTWHQIPFFHARAETSDALNLIFHARAGPPAVPSPKHRQT